MLELPTLRYIDLYWVVSYPLFLAQFLVHLSLVSSLLALFYFKKHQKKTQIESPFQYGTFKQTVMRQQVKQVTNHCKLKCDGHNKQHIQKKRTKFD